jgi:simple sugar transport system substrate-binding protein
VDAVHDGLQALADGKFNFVVECNPLLGGQLMDTAKKVKAGEKVPNRIVTVETVFDQAKAKEALPTRKY